MSLVTIGSTRRFAALATAAFLASAGNASGAAGGSVQASCGAIASAPTTSGQTAYVMQSTATATHSSPGVVATGMSVSCRIFDRSTGQVYGTTSGGGAPAGAGVGVVVVPQHADLATCVRASALFSDGSTASFDNC